MKPLTKEDKRAFYNEILRLYDLCEQVLDKLPSESPMSETIANIAIPVPEVTQESTDRLATAYADYIECGEVLHNEDGKTIEKELRTIFHAVLAFKEQIKELPGEDSFQVKEYQAKPMDPVFKRILGVAPESYCDGPNYRDFRAQMQRLPEHADIISAVLDIGVQTMLLGRVFELVGVVDGKNFEPGYNFTGLQIARDMGKPTRGAPSAGPAFKA